MLDSERLLFTQAEKVRTQLEVPAPCVLGSIGHKGNTETKKPGDGYSMSGGTPVVEEPMLCCSYKPLYSLEVCPQSVRRKGLLFYQNPGGDKNLFMTALQEEGEASEKWPHSSSSQASHVLVFCAPGGSSGFLSRLRLSCSSVLTFVACVDMCKASRVPPEDMAEPCP